MNTNERPTPETDNEELHAPYLVRELPFCVVRIDLARRLERERDEAREELDDWRNAAAHVKSNHSDEVHCTCVPILQKLLADARNERDEARDRITELEKQLAELQKPKESETFEAHDLTWVKHVSGDPMPCYGDAKIRVLLRCSAYGSATGSQLDWSEKQSYEGQIIGWNYADVP